MTGSRKRTANININASTDDIENAARIIETLNDTAKAIDKANISDEKKNELKAQLSGIETMVNNGATPANINAKIAEANTAFREARSGTKKTAIAEKTADKLENIRENISHHTNDDLADLRNETTRTFVRNKKGDGKQTSSKAPSKFWSFFCCCAGKAESKDEQARSLLKNQG